MTPKVLWDVVRAGFPTNQRRAAVDQTPAARAFARRNFEVSAGRTRNLASGFVAADEHTRVPGIGKV
jgi:hypothetical protein